MAHSNPSRTAILAAFFAIFVSVLSSPEEAKSLIDFKNTLTNTSKITGWVETSDPCGSNPKWFGIRCQDGKVLVVQLENIGLTGTIDVGPLANLSTLRSLSLANNSFSGPMPDFRVLVALKSLFLSGNGFFGEIPDNAFEGMVGLRQVYFGYNEFTGKIPKSLVGLPRLVDLNLESNRFGGRIPDFRQMELEMVDLANNQFVGKIPKSLSKMDPSYFTGNNNLCGKPLAACKSHKKRIIVIVIAIVVASVLVLATLIVVYCVWRSKSKQARSKGISVNSQNERNNIETQDRVEGGPEDRVVVAKAGKSGKLCFVRTDRPDRFELSQLLRASAEVLGSGSFGSSYKAVIVGGPAMVVKRFRHMNNVGKEEFYHHMRRLGGLGHPNLLPLVAFYYRKEEKLLVSNFAPNGSLASHLHANRIPGQPGLDWPTRLKIIKGVAEGLSYLYKELSDLTLPHGHLKSSNVLLDHEFNPIISDYALVPVVNKDHAHQFMVAYKSPEFSHHNRTTRKTDVWSLGILVLELLTGKFPANYMTPGKGGNADLAVWVNSVVREEWTGEVFDKDMRGVRNAEGEMLKLLKIGMCCCERNTEKRWDIREAVGRISELKERDVDEDYSSYASDGDVYSSKGVTDDDFSFSVTHG